MQVRYVRLDDAQSNLDTHIASVAQELCIDIERVIREEVISSGSNSDGDF